MASVHPVLAELLRGESLLLDGSTTDELASRGYRPTGPLGDATAARDAPDVLAAIHHDFITAGARVISAYTSKTTVRALARGGFGMRASAITHRAVDLALEEAAKSAQPVAVAGVLGALEHDGAALPTRQKLEAHSEQCARLAVTGCNLVLVEEMASLPESVAATSAAASVLPEVWTVLPVRGGAVDNVPLPLALQVVAAAGAKLVMLSVSDPSELNAALEVAQSSGAGIAFGARISAAGMPPARFASALAPLRNVGARVLSGGAGTSVEHVRALARALGRAVTEINLHPR